MSNKRSVKICLEPIVSLFRPIQIDSPSTSPDQHSQSPDQSTPSPDQSTPSPDQHSPSPDQSTPSPDQHSPSPDQNTQSPDQNTPSLFDYSLYRLGYSSIAMDMLTEKPHVYYLDSPSRLSPIPEGDEDNCESPVLCDKTQNVN